MTLRQLTIIFCTIYILLSAKSSADVRYTLTALGLPGGSDSRATDINNAGEVVGWSYIIGEEIPHAFIYSSTSGISDLHQSGLMSQANAINSTGTIIGMTFAPPNNPQTTIWRNGLGSTINSSVVRSIGNSINTYGDLAGDIVFDGYRHAYRYTSGGGEANEHLQDLGTLGGSTSFGLAINDPGTVVGSSLTSSSNWQQHAFISRATRPHANEMIDIGTLGGEHSEARAINNSGTVVGWAWQENGRSEAFVYSNGNMRGLGTLGGFSSSACGINESGNIVGWWSPDGLSRRAFLYSQGNSSSTMTDLTSLIDPLSGWTLIEATAINDSGMIVGYGIDPNGNDRGFLLTPVPAPTSATFLIGAGMVFVTRRKR